MTSPKSKTSRAPDTAKPAPPPNFDTMNAMGMLTRAGFVQGQASAIVGTVRDAQRELATKADLDQAVGMLRVDLDHSVGMLRADLEHSVGMLRTGLDQAAGMLRADLDQAAGMLRADLDRTAGELRAEMKTVKLELEKNLEEQDSKVERQFTQLYRHLWISMGMTIIAITGILGMMMAFSG